MKEYDIDFMCYYAYLFLEQADSHIFRFYLFSFRDPNFNAHSFSFKLMNKANEIFYQELENEKSEDQALFQALKIFDKRIIKP